MLIISAVTPIVDFVILVENVLVMIVYDCLDTLHGAITQFISDKRLVKDVVFREMFTYYMHEILAYSQWDNFTVS